MQQKLISAQTSDTTGHDPRRVFWVVFSYQLLETPDVLIRLSSFGHLHLVTFCENKSHWYLNTAEIQQRQRESLDFSLCQQTRYKTDRIVELKIPEQLTLLRPSQLAQSRSIF